MKRSRYFLVYRSQNHSYVRFVLMALPLLCLCLALETGFSFLYYAAAGTVLLCIPFLALLYAVLRVDNRGVHLLRLFCRPRTLLWTDIRCHGVLTVPYLGSGTPAYLQYVSRNPVPGSITKQGTLPKLTDDFLFATVQPGLAEAMQSYQADL